MKVYIVNHWAISDAQGPEAVFRRRDAALAHARRDVGRRGYNGRGWVKSEDGSEYGMLNDEGTDLINAGAGTSGLEVIEFEVQ